MDDVTHVNVPHFVKRLGRLECCKCEAVGAISVYATCSLRWCTLLLHQSVDQSCTIYGCFFEEKLNHQLDKMHAFATQFYGLDTFILGAVRLGWCCRLVFWGGFNKCRRVCFHFNCVLLKGGWAAEMHTPMAGVAVGWDGEGNARAVLITGRL